MTVLQVVGAFTRASSYIVEVVTERGHVPDLAPGPDLLAVEMHFQCRVVREEHVQPLVVDGLTMVGPDVLKLDGDFTQPCQLTCVATGGAVTHRAQQLAVEFVCATTYVVKESVASGIDAVAASKPDAIRMIARINRL